MSREKRGDHESNMPQSAESGENYTLEWLQSYRSDLAGSVDHNEVGTGFTARLFRECLAELRGLCLRKESAGDPGSLSTPYWNELDKLYLWGVPFENGMMDIALEASDKLRFKVIDLLQSIAKALLTC